MKLEIGMQKQLNKRNEGFTLIEILIVITIISIVATTAIITVSHNKNSRLETLAKQIKNIIILAEQESMLRAKTFGLGFTPHTFQFHMYNEKQRAWQALTDKIYGSHSIADNTTITVKVQKKNIPLDGKPKIIISPSGDVTPFVILIGNQEEPPRYQVVGEENGNVKYVLVKNEE